MDSFASLSLADLHSPFRPTIAGDGEPSAFVCPNPSCGVALADHNSVCDHLAVPGSSCTQWAMEYVENILNQDPEDDGDVHWSLLYLRCALTCQ